jgi:cell division protein FtsI/penicillin-binding protein 2
MSLGGAETTLLKRIAILAAALFCLGDATTPAATPALAAGAETQPTAHASPRKLTSRRTTAHHARRRRRRWNPWHVSSFSDPGADDDPAGEDPVVRAAAVEAMGRWNGSVVVVDPNTGRILSIVNQKLALGSAFTPCSTFKPVVALGALKEGLITPETQLTVGRRTHMDLADALAHSNNRFFSKLGEMLGFDRLAGYARAFGLGTKAGWEIPDESSGRFPDHPPKQGGVGLVASYGQDIEVTPLQMAAILSAIANGGMLYYLQYPRTPEQITAFAPKARRHLEDLSDYFPYVKQGLAAAVIYGTARSAYDPEEQIFGKTGTCSEDGARLGWFVSYAEEQQAKYVVVVLLRGGRPMYGPHAAEIAGRLYRDLRLKEQNAMRAQGPILLTNSTEP